MFVPLLQNLDGPSAPAAEIRVHWLEVEHSAAEIRVHWLEFDPDFVDDQSTIGGKRRRSTPPRAAEDPGLVQQVIEKWETIEAAQARSIDLGVAAPKPSPKPSPKPAIGDSMVDAMAQATAAAEIARISRIRNDEAALLLLIAELI